MAPIGIRMDVSALRARIGNELGAGSGWSQDDLRLLLNAARDVSGMTDEDALERLDRVVAGILGTRPVVTTVGGVDDFYRQHGADMVERLRRQLKDVRAGIGTPGAISSWDVQGLRSLADDGMKLIRTQDEAIVRQVENLQAEALEVAPVAELQVLKETVCGIGSRTLHNISSARRAAEDLCVARERLESLGLLSPELAADIRLAEERSAWFRTRKRLDEAEVVRAGGNLKKADRLLAEARAMLAQDWAAAFPGEATPEIPLPNRPPG